MALITRNLIEKKSFAEFVILYTFEINKYISKQKSSKYIYGFQNIFIQYIFSL